MYDYFHPYNHNPTIQRLDNDTSSDLEVFLRACDVKIQYVPPGIHRQNPSERAIRHTKNCIIAMCTTADPSIPAHILFEEVVPQAEIVINQVRPWSPNPRINAWTGFRRAEYDHLAHPMSIFGMKVVIHEKPPVRGTWAQHGKDGFYLAPALSHYRSWHVYVSETGGTRVSDTLAWFPKPFKMPGHSPLEQLTAAVVDLDNAVSNLTSADMETLQPVSPIFQSTFSTSVQQLRNLLSGSPAETSSAELNEPVVTTPVISSSLEITHPLQRVPSSMPPEQSVQVPSPSDNAEEVFPPPTTNDTDVPTYIWTAVRKQDAPKRCVKYFANMNRFFQDDTGTFQIVDIDRNSAILHGEGSQTLFYKFFNVIEHLTPPSNIDDYDHIPCAELHRDPTVQWTSRARLASAFMSTTSLNLNEDGSPLTFSKALDSPHRDAWQLEHDVEIRKLISGTKTMHPVHRNTIPQDRQRDITYFNPVCREKMKDGKIKRRVRGSIGGDRINYPGDVSARTASLEVVRTLLNSVLADDANFMTADITDYYLGTPLKRPEYVRIATKHLSDTIIREYDLDKMSTDGYVYFEVVKGMYGLPQAGLLAQQRLIAHLAKSEYIQSPVIPCLFRHPTNGVTFVLVVDDFGVKFQNAAGRDHFLDTLRSLYAITVDEQGSQYLGMCIEHDKKLATISISMPGYIARVLERFQDWAGTRRANTPGVYNKPAYGAKEQHAVIDDTEPLSAKDTTTLQAITGSLAYYARAVDPTMLLYNINFITSVGVQGCDRQPSVRRVIWLTMHNRLLQD